MAVASGRGHSGAVTIHQQGAVMWVGRLGDGETVTLPDAPFVHVFAARGDVRLGDTTLHQGDAARLSGAGPLELVADGDAEVIVWESDAAATR